MLTVMAEVCGVELLDRLTEWAEPESNPTPMDDTASTSKPDPRIEVIFEKLRADPDIEVGFRRRKWLNLDQL